MPTSPTRKQRELLAIAKSMAAGRDAKAVIDDTGLNPGLVYHCLRSLRHLRVTAEDVNNVIAATGENADDYLLALFTARRLEQKQRRKLARKLKGGAV